MLAGTGLRDLDRLGGLARRMPATTILFGVAALGACGLPLGAGFVSEWLLVQSLIHAPPEHQQRLVALAMPLAVGAVALTTGLGVAAMVKAFGVGFLARPRCPMPPPRPRGPAEHAGRDGRAPPAPAWRSPSRRCVLATPLHECSTGYLPASARADLSRPGRRSCTCPALAGSIAPA